MLRLGLPEVRSLGLLLSLSLVPCHCEVTVYHANNQAAFATTSVPASQYSGVAAYNPTTLIPAPPQSSRRFPCSCRMAGCRGRGCP
ncbi:hypothetical protein DFH06DRAFT_1209258 [Mycena polygramma]|nr:hypothetical protein DFH06DRAFT_1209258 [Mycena polygramma]